MCIFNRTGEKLLVKRKTLIGNLCERFYFSHGKSTPEYVFLKKKYIYKSKYMQ